jgi:CubicO group peptidase (beta-lactamase class C family)
MKLRPLMWCVRAAVLCWLVGWVHAEEPSGSRTRIALENGRWTINGAVTCPGSRAEGLLMNVRMVNAVFEDTNEATRPPGFDAEANADAFVAKIPEYVSHGVRAFTIGLQGGSCGYGKPVVCNEDDKTGEEGAAAAEACVDAGASWGLMLVERNQHYPFTFAGTADDPVVYAKLKILTSAPAASATRDGAYFPAPDSMGGWRQLKEPDEVRRVGGMDPEKLDSFRQWLLDSDDRPFAAVVVSRGHVVLEVERGNSAKTDARRVASVSKAICATVLAIASERSLDGRTPRVMRFDDAAFPFLPWAYPLSDPRKAQITVKQLLNHTSGLCPEATGAPNDGSWDYILGHTGDPRTARLAFDPGTACGYSTHAFDHAGLVCESVTGLPYDEFAIEALLRPLGIEHWTFSGHDGLREQAAPPRRRHSHGIGLPARALARIGYCLLRNGRWEERQVVPEWFVKETAAPTHQVTSEELRFKLPARTFSHGWELPAERGEAGRGIPADARFKPGSGGQVLAFIPSLDLVVARQTGGSGPWEYEEAIRRACAAVLGASP